MDSLPLPDMPASSSPTDPSSALSVNRATGGDTVPVAPRTLEDTQLPSSVIESLILKLAHATHSFTTEWAAERLHLPVLVLEPLLERLSQEALVETLGQVSHYNHRYCISPRGVEHARRYFEACGYIGPAPVSLNAYTDMLESQVREFPATQPWDVAEAISELVLDDNSVRVAGLAISAGRSLFLHGPPGNGKTSLGRLLHGALHGAMWIPHCVDVDGNTMRVFDPLCHQPLPFPGKQPFDRRWVLINRPLIVAGGELTLASLDVAFSPTTRFYQAPLHMKANGGLFLIDDFGRQRVDPRALLNRWIVPLEYGVDNLTLRTGQVIQVPFRPLVIIATNFVPSEVADSAFLRRIGYQLELSHPSPQRYREIFRRCAKERGLSVPPALFAGVLDRYRREGRELRACDPQDLLERVVDICRYDDDPLELNQERLDLAWRSYFGETPRRP